jgi:pimeloyl-ACP methyl ester carboxylesterase
MDNGFTRAFMQRMSNSSFGYVLVRLLAFGKKPPASEVEELQRMNFSAPIATLRGAARGGLSYEFEHYLPNVSIPVMLLVGSEDSLMASNRENKLTYSLLPDARLRVFEGAGHMAPQEQHEEFNKALGDFLTECFA